jgi:hypothetical protein
MIILKNRSCYRNGFLFRAIPLNLRPKASPPAFAGRQAHSLSKREGGQTVVFDYAFALTLHLPNKNHLHKSATPMQMLDERKPGTKNHILQTKN